MREVPWLAVSFSCTLPRIFATWARVLLPKIFQKERTALRVASLSVLLHSTVPLLIFCLTAATKDLLNASKFPLGYLITEILLYLLGAGISPLPL